MGARVRVRVSTYLDARVLGDRVELLLAQDVLG